MANRFTQAAQTALNKSLVYARELGHTYIGSEHILLSLLSADDSVAVKLLDRFGITFDRMREKIAELCGQGDPTDVGPNDMTPRCRKIIENAGYASLKCGSSYIGTEHILLALIEETDSVAVRLLAEFGVNTAELANDILSYTKGSAEGFSQSSDRPRSTTGTVGKGIGRKGSGLSSAPTLKQYGRDLTAMAREGSIDPVIGRDAEMERVIQILSRRTKNNPCLIGEPGVGKTAVVEGLAQRIADNDVPETLAGKTVVTLDLSGMIAGAKYRGEFEERLKGIMGEIAKNPHIILFIDEIHTLIGAGAAEGAIDAANILKPALARGEMQVIGATTIAEYRKHIEKDAALERRFQSVTVGEPSPEEAVAILKGLRDKYEAHHKLTIPDEAIEAAVHLSRRYINDRYLPDKAIDLIDEAASRKRMTVYTFPPHVKELEARLKETAAEKEEAIKAQSFEKAASLRDEEKKLKEELEEAKKSWKDSHSEEKLSITHEDIAEIVTAWTGIPVKKLADEEGSRLLRLDEILKERIIGQDEAVTAVARAIRRGRTGLKDPKRPLGSFIFLGPTGVGKTELTKALADVLFGDENAMIRVDMSEYMEKHSVSKLIGSPPGYVGFEEGGQLTQKIRRKPYSVVLFDEIEKAHPDVFNILLQILEDGILTDSQGRKVDFKNTVIIMTSNVGAQSINEPRRPLGFAASDDSEDVKKTIESGVMGYLKDTFRPEFLNRIDEIIIFNRLSDENIARIARIMLNDVEKRIHALGIAVSFDEALVKALAKEGFDPVYGARPLRRAIQRKVEDTFSTAMLEGQIQSGDTVLATPDEKGETVFVKTEKTVSETDGEQKTE